MEEFAANRRDALLRARPSSHPPPPPPRMARNPHQPPMPPMFGNLNAPAPNTYPQINVPPQMQHPRGPQVNPNMPMMQPPYPPPQFHGPMPGAPPAQGGQLPPFVGGRPREWEGANDRNMYEPDSKRMRPFPPDPNNNAFPNQQPPPFNRVPPPQMPSRNPNLCPPGIYTAQHHPRMLPHNPPIHPPNPQAMQFQQRQGPFPPPAGGIPPAQGGPPLQQNPSIRDGFQFPPKIQPQFPSQPAQQPQGPPQGAFDRLPPPPRKDMRVASAQGPALSGLDGRASGNDLNQNKNEEQPLSFKDFLAQQPDNISSHAAQEAYDVYVATFSKGKPNKFFESQKDKEWFKERYDPDYVSDRIVRIREEVQERARDYRKVWDQGGSAVCAPDLSADSRGTRYPRGGPHVAGEGRPSESSSPTHEQESRQGEAGSGIEKSLERSPKLETEQAGNDVKKEETDDMGVKSEDKLNVAEGHGDEKGESKTQDELEVEQKDDVKAGIKDEEGQATARSGEGLPEDVSAGAEMNEPQVSKGSIGLIPDKKEADVAHEKKEGAVSTFKLKGDEQTDAPVSSVEPNTSRENPQDDRVTAPLLKAAATSGKDASQLALPLRREHQKDTIFMRGIPMNTSRDALTTVLKHGKDGSQNFNLRRLKLGDINPHRGLQRFGWAVYDSAETAAAALEAVRGAKVKPVKKKKSTGKTAGEAGDAKDADEVVDPESIYEVDCMLNLERKKKFTQGRVLPYIFGTDARMRHDVEQSVKMMRALNSARYVDSGLNPLTDEFLASLEDDEQRLDHVVTYLREVHYFCYYSGNEFLEDPTSMPPQELRPTERSRGMSEADNRLVKRIDERAKWVLDRDYDRPRSNSDNSDLAKKVAVQKWLDANTTMVGPNRFRCGLPPNKLFKGAEFVHKHLRVKHSDKMRTIMEAAYLDVYRANFENDASRDEVVSIFEEGLAGAQNDAKGQGPPSGNGGRNQQQQFPAPAGNVPMGMYNGVNPFMTGMQPMQMMMMPRGNFGGPGYAGGQGYPNAIGFAGRGAAVGPVAPGMTPGGLPAAGAQPSEAIRPDPRQQGNIQRDFRERGTRDPRDSSNRDQNLRGGGHREGGNRDGGYRDSGHREGGFRGKRGGFSKRGGGSHFRGGNSDVRPLDPRARNSRRGYNDLDAPSNAPAFDLVRYDDV